MKIEIRKSAIKDLKKIDKKFINNIHTKIIGLKEFPKINDIKKLTNFEPSYRLRIGDFRILFDVLDETVIIGRVLHRKESYNK